MRLKTLFALLISLSFVSFNSFGESVEKDFRDYRGNLAQSLAREARSFYSLVRYGNYDYRALEAAKTFKNRTQGYAACERGDYDDRDDRYNSRCRGAERSVINAFRKLEREFPYSYGEVEESMRKLRRLVRRLNGRRGGGVDPYPYPNPRPYPGEGSYVCYAEPEEGWNTRRFSGTSLYSKEEARDYALSACEREYNYCIITSCNRRPY
jgi:hypothetical protein